MHKSHREKYKLLFQANAFPYADLSVKLERK